jgi:hypothetical protein
MHLKGKKFIIGTSPLFNCIQSHNAACLHKIVLARRIRFYRFFLAINFTLSQQFKYLTFQSKVPEVIWPVKIHRKLVITNDIPVWIQSVLCCRRIMFAPFCPLTLLTYQLTDLLTPWSRALREKVTVFQLVKKFPAFYGTRRFYYRIYKCPPPVPNLSQLDPVHTPTYF